MMHDLVPIGCVAVVAILAYGLYLFITLDGGNIL